MKRLITRITLCSLILTNIYIAQDKLYPNEFPLEDVQLLEGPFKHARDLNIEVLLKYDIDLYEYHFLL